MSGTLPFDLTALLLFRDDEDVIAQAVLALAAVTEAAQIRLEIVPIDLGSGDNCRAIMNIMPAPCALRQPVGTISRSLFGPALDVAQGHVIGVLDPRAAIEGATQLASAYTHVASRGSDAMQVSDTFMLLRRDRNERAMRSLVGIGVNLHARLGRAVKGSGRTLGQAAAVHPQAPKAAYFVQAAQWAGKLLGRTSA